MVKKIIKEIIIVLLLCLAIILILGVLLYDYVPMAKIVPEPVSYNTPEVVEKELATSSEIDQSQIIMTYEIEYLWTKIGNHAKSEGAVIKIDVAKGTNTTKNTYNLEFTVNGTYIAITDFISDIENDSSLGFKIEEFEMSPGDGTNLKATFVCKDITYSKEDFFHEKQIQNFSESGKRKEHYYGKTYCI